MREVKRMNRFFGMMPSDEIEIENVYKDEHGYKICIQAGSHGWTIIYADSSSEYNDVDNTSVENNRIAYDIATHNLGTLTEIK